MKETVLLLIPDVAVRDEVLVALLAQGYEVRADETWPRPAVEARGPAAFKAAVDAVSLRATRLPVGEEVLFIREFRE